MPSMSQPRQTYPTSPQDPYAPINQAHGASFSQPLPTENVAYSQAQRLPLSPRGAFPQNLPAARFSYDHTAVPQLPSYTDPTRPQLSSAGGVLGHSTLHDLADTGEVKYPPLHNAMQPRVAAPTVTSHEILTSQQAPTVSYADSNSAVLSHDAYQDAYQFQAPAPWAAGKNAHCPAPGGLSKGARKGKRKPVTYDAGAQREEERKRTRGRPRLETTDQTPEDRRRTQIRVAQRAYRSRKENTLTDLDSKLQAQKEINLEMKEAYQSLFEHARRHGILHGDPQFSHQMEKLQSSWHRTQDDEPRGDKSSSPEGGQKRSPAEPLSAVERDFHQKNVPNSLNPESTPGQHIYEGLVLPPDHAARPQGVPNAHGHGMSMAESSRVEYQIITSPTADNASFAGLFNPSPIAWHSPWESLPPPSTFSHQESNLSRRLHRFTCEKAARLITLSNPPCDKMLRVFGFARLFETTEQIRDRTLSTIRKMAHESLNNWAYPFHHLGGAGTHMPSRRSGSGASGQSGFSAMETGPFRIGPMDIPTSHIRSSMLTITQGMRVPGLQGVFWDCEEVEYYMRENGVPLPDLAAVDFLSAELFPTSFNYRDPNGDGQPAVGPGTRVEEMIQVTGAPGPSTATVSLQSSPDAPNVMTSTAMESTGAGHTPGLRAPVTDSATVWPAQPVTTTAGFYPNIGVEANDYTQRSSLPQFPAVGGRKLVRVDVSRFLEGLTGRAVCLGRTPGFRPNDVDAAFWDAIVPESGM